MHRDMSVSGFMIDMFRVSAAAVQVTGVDHFTLLIIGCFEEKASKNLHREKIATTVILMLVVSGRFIRLQF